MSFFVEEAVDNRLRTAYAIFSYEEKVRFNVTVHCSQFTIAIFSFCEPYNEFYIYIIIKIIFKVNGLPTLIWDKIIWNDALSGVKNFINHVIVGHPTGGIS